MRLLCQIIILFFQFVICPTTLWAQELEFEHLGTEDGLPATEAYNLYQDKQGYVWAFTEYGIVKHNGHSFTPACTNLPFSESAIYAITEDKTGNLIVANSNARLYIIIDNKAHLLPGLEAISNYILANAWVIYQIICKDEVVYFSTYQQTWSYDLKTHRTKTESASLNKKLKYGYLVETEKKIFPIIHQPHTVKSIDSPMLLGSYHQSKNRWFVFKKNDNYYSFGETDKNCKYKKDQLVYCKEFTSPVLYATLAPNNQFWVGTSNQGLFVIDTNLQIVNHLFPNESISNILFDNQQGIWLTTIGNGIFHCKNLHVKSLNQSPFQEDQITLVKNCNNLLFIGTEKGKLFTLNNHQLKEIPIPSTYYNKDVLFLNNYYYVYSKKNLIKLDSNFRIITNTTISVYHATVIDNNRLFIASTSFLCDYDLAQNTWKRTPIYKPTCTAIRKNGQKLAGTRNGVFEFDESNKVICPPYLTKLKGMRISALVNGTEGKLYICTQGEGIFVLDKQNHLTSLKNLPSKIVKNIFFFHNQLTIISTNRGLYLSKGVDAETPNNWHLLLEGDITGFDETNGYLCVSTKKKLVLIPFKDLPGSSKIPFLLNTVLINDTLTSIPQLSRLNYLTKKIQLNFDILNYQFKENQLYYELAGKSKGAGNITGTSLVLQNLEPGEYELLVYHSFDKNISKNNALIIPFTIIPAFWQQRWFKIVLILASLLTTSILTYIMVNRRRKAEKAKSVVDNLILEYKLTALKSQINPHFISNALAAIQHQILLGNTDKANLYLAKFSLLIRHVLTYSDKSAANLKDELTVIDLNVELEQLRFGNNFKYSKEIDADADLRSIYIPPLITQPFIENAIWHGLLPIKDERECYLLVKIDIENDSYLVIRIIDNGIGLKNSKSEKISNLKGRESKGTQLIINRIENLNKLYKTREIKVEIRDRSELNPVEIGTEVKLTFPLDVLEQLKDEKDKSPAY